MFADDLIEKHGKELIQLGLCDELLYSFTGYEIYLVKSLCKLQQEINTLKNQRLVGLPKY